MAGDQVIDNVLFVDLDQSLKQETVLSTSQVSSIKYQVSSSITPDRRALDSDPCSGHTRPRVAAGQTRGDTSCNHEPGANMISEVNMNF